MIENESYDPAMSIALTALGFFGSLPLSSQQQLTLLTPSKSSYILQPLTFSNPILHRPHLAAEISAPTPPHCGGRARANPDAGSSV